MIRSNMNKSSMLQRLEKYFTQAEIRSASAWMLDAFQFTNAPTMSKQSAEKFCDELLKEQSLTTRAIVLMIIVPTTQFKILAKNSKMTELLASINKILKQRMVMPPKEKELNHEV